MFIDKKQHTFNVQNFNDLGCSSLKFYLQSSFDGKELGVMELKVWQEAWLKK